MGRQQLFRTPGPDRLPGPPVDDGDDVLVSGFGKFCVKEKRPRRGRNPATGQDLMLRERKVVTFKCSGKLREKINS